MIYPKILRYCYDNNLTISSFEKKCGLANGTVGKYKDGGYPSVNTLKKIEAATKVPIKKWLE